MAELILVRCSDCHKKSPSTEKKCLWCGGNLEAEQIHQTAKQITQSSQQNIKHYGQQPGTHSNVVVIEQTAKSIKLQLLLSSIMIIASLVVLFAGHPVIGSFLFIASVIWHFLTRFMAWWKHG